MCAYSNGHLFNRFSRGLFGNKGQNVEKQVLAYFSNSIL